MKKQTDTVTLTDGDFNRQVLEYPHPVVVCFTANWSGSSDIMLPIVDDLAERFAGKVRFGKIDADKNRRLAAELGVASVPTLVLFRKGSVVEIIQGVISGSELAEKVRAQL